MSYLMQTSALQFLHCRFEVFPCSSRPDSNDQLVIKLCWSPIKTRIRRVALRRERPKNMKGKGSPRTRIKKKKKKKTTMKAMWNDSKHWNSYKKDHIVSPWRNADYFNSTTTERTRSASEAHLTWPNGAEVFKTLVKVETLERIKSRDKKFRKMSPVTILLNLYIFLLVLRH